MYQYPYGDTQQLNLDWILTKIRELEQQSGSGGSSIEEVANALISATYNAANAYRRYDYCYYNGKLYRCLSDTTGAFNPADWQEVLIGDDIPVLTRLINAVDASLTSLQTTVNNDLKFPNRIKVLTSSNDLNDYFTEDDSGWYELRDNVINAPASYCRCLVIGGSGASQVVFTTNHVYVRMYTGTPLAWTAWETIPNLTELTSEATARGNTDAAIENAIAIVSNGNTHAAIASGQFVYIKNHNTLAEGLYRATTAIPIDGTLTASNVTSANGSLNTLLDGPDPVYIDAAIDSVVPFTFIKVGKIVELTALYVYPRSNIAAGAWTSFGTAPAIVRPTGNRYMAGLIVSSNGTLLSTVRIYLGADGEFGGYFSNAISTTDGMFLNVVYVL